MNQPAGNQRDFLGVGWKFPLQVTPGGQIAQARYEQRIEESIYLILSTAKGERVMLPDFGCGIHDLVFAPNNSDDALRSWSRRCAKRWSLSSRASTCSTSARRARRKSPTCC